jgi:hypothetical protein
MMAMPIGGTSVGLYPGTVILVILILNGKTLMTSESLLLSQVMISENLLVGNIFELAISQ